MIRVGLPFASFDPHQPHAATPWSEGDRTILIGSTPRQLDRLTSSKTPAAVRLGLQTFGGCWTPLILIAGSSYSDTGCICMSQWRCTRQDQCGDVGDDGKRLCGDSTQLFNCPFPMHLDTRGEESPGTCIKPRAAVCSR